MSWDTCRHCNKSLVSGSHGEGVCAGDPVPCPKMYEPGEAQRKAVNNRYFGIAPVVRSRVLTSEGRPEDARNLLIALDAVEERLSAAISERDALIGRGHVYLIPANIFRMAWGACVLSSKYDKSKWVVLEDELMLATVRYLDQQDLNGGNAVRECLYRVGNLMREQNGNPERIQKALVEAEEHARSFLGDLVKLPVNDSRRTYISYLQCLGWNEVENMRKVLRLPEGTG